MVQGLFFYKTFLILCKRTFKRKLPLLLSTNGRIKMVLLSKRKLRASDNNVQATKCFAIWGAQFQINNYITVRYKNEKCERGKNEELQEIISRLKRYVSNHFHNNGNLFLRAIHSRFTHNNTLFGCARINFSKCTLNTLIH